MGWKMEVKQLAKEIKLIVYDVNKREIISCFPETVKVEIIIPNIVLAVDSLISEMFRPAKGEISTITLTSYVFLYTIKNSYLLLLVIPNVLEEEDVDEIQRIYRSFIERVEPQKIKEIVKKVKDIIDEIRELFILRVDPESALYAFLNEFFFISNPEEDECNLSTILHPEKRLGEVLIDAGIIDRIPGSMNEFRELMKSNQKVRNLLLCFARLYSKGVIKRISPRLAALLMIENFLNRFIRKIYNLTGKSTLRRLLKSVIRDLKIEEIYDFDENRVEIRIKIAREAILSGDTMLKNVEFNEIQRVYDSFSKLVFKLINNIRDYLGDQIAEAVKSEAKAALNTFLLYK